MKFVTENSVEQPPVVVSLLQSADGVSIRVTHNGVVQIIGQLGNNGCLELFKLSPSVAKDMGLRIEAATGTIVATR